MSTWITQPANLLKQSYVQGFVDVSGGDIIARTGGLHIAGNSYLNNNLIVNGSTVLTGLVTINNDILFNGNVKLATGNLQEQIDELSAQVVSLTQLSNSYQQILNIIYLSLFNVRIYTEPTSLVIQYGVRAPGPLYTQFTTDMNQQATLPLDEFVE